MSTHMLIVTADDFGLSAGVNRGVIAAFENGIVTSASLMVRAEAASEAAAYGRARPDLDLGIHLDLGEWRYEDEAWRPSYEVVDGADRAAVEAEVARQLALFSTLVGRPPSHVDSHQHVHRNPPVAGVVRTAGRRLEIPVREQQQAIRYRGDFFGQTGRGDPYPDAITVESLVALIHSLPAGITELGCHPGYASDADTTYRDERAREVAALCDPRIRQALDAGGVQLTSFSRSRAQWRAA